MTPSDKPTPAQVEASPSKKKNVPNQRRGPKGHFQESRKEFLESYLPKYLACKKGNRQKFWHELYSAWWLRYPWRLDDDKEPPADNPKKMASLAAVAPGDEVKKAFVEKTLTERLTTWFINRASAANNGSRRDTLSWLPLLRQLHKIRNPQPRRRSAVQQFMRDNPREVNAAFVSRHGEGKNLNSVQRLNLRYGIAKTMLSNKHPSVVSKLESKAEAVHAADMDEWNMTLNDISLAKDVSQARDSLFDAVFPLLEGIGTYADCYVTLVAGNAGKDDCDEGFFTAVHWWPGDRSTTKNWTQWNEDEFNSGVAGSFLTYAAENNRLLQGADKQQPMSAIQKPQTSILNTTPIVDNILPRNHAAPHIHSTTTNANRQTKYRPAPTKTQPSKGTNGKKRKHTSEKTRLIQYFEDSESNDDTNDNSGDGTSSGDSIGSDAARMKRRKVSRVNTRSSARGAVPDAMVGASGSTSVSPATITNTNDAVGTDGDVNTDIDDAHTDIDDVVHSDIEGIVHSDIEVVAHSDVDDVVRSDVDDVAHSDIDDVALTDVDNVVHSDVDDIVHSDVDDVVQTNTDTEDIATPGISTTTGPRVSSPMLLDDIDVADIPAFLLRHGTRKRQVNIFDYLKSVKDPHFQRVLFYYLRLEISNKAGLSSALPTTGRPIEISHWSSRARPASLPDYKKGGRTLTAFTDSIFVWWGSIQPSWRVFERGTVSREVSGGWDVLHVLRINGLLNVVMLAYWWARILEEDEPKDGVRADYEFFTDDVAWVLSNLST